MSSTLPNSGDFFFGFNLLYRTVEKDITRKHDVCIVLTHFVLMRHAHFRCLGVGESKTLLSTEVGSELLPEGWNDSPEKYSLRYIANEQLYLLLGYTTENSFILNLLDVKSHKVSNISLMPDDLVKKTNGSLSDIMPTAPQVADRIRKELIDPIFNGGTREATTQTAASNNSERGTSRLVINDPAQPRPFHPAGSFGVPGPFGVPGYGSSDLDPLGRLGQGNIFPFPSRPNFQGSAQPRFDPFGPPDGNVPPNPNPDHLQPPGFGGDYFS